MPLSPFREPQSEGGNVARGCWGALRLHGDTPLLPPRPVQEPPDAPGPCSSAWGTWGGSWTCGSSTAGQLHSGFQLTPWVQAPSLHLWGSSLAIHSQTFSCRVFCPRPGSVQPSWAEQEPRGRARVKAP